MRIGSVILESSHLVIDRTRYPSIIIGWNLFRQFLLLLHLFPPIFKYSFSHLIIIRCYCSRITHQKKKQLCLILIPSVSLNPIHIDNHESLNIQFTNLIESFITINNLISLFTPINQPIHDCDNQIHSLSINTPHRSIQWLMSYTMSNNSIHLHSHSLIIRMIRTQFIHSHDNEYNRFKREGFIMEHSSDPTDQLSQSLFSTQ